MDAWTKATDALPGIGHRVIVQFGDGSVRSVHLWPKEEYGKTLLIWSTPGEVIYSVDISDYWTYPPDLSQEAP